VNDIVAHVAGHIELEELPLAAGFFEGRKVLLAVSDRVKMVILAVEPDRWPTVARTTCKECLIDKFGDGTSFAKLPAHKIDDTQSLLGMHSCIDDRQHAAT
jgi:hypothetical protein